jgi:hypothetical protein
MIELMWILATIGLFVVNSAWRATRLSYFGRVIAKNLGSPNENLRTLAAMFLTRAGRLAEPILEEALHKRESLPMVLIILADIGDKRAAPEIQRYSGHEDPHIAEAARQALRVLAMQR